MGCCTSFIEMSFYIFLSSSLALPTILVFNHCFKFQDATEFSVCRLWPVWASFDMEKYWKMLIMISMLVLNANNASHWYPVFFEKCPFNNKIKWIVPAIFFPSCINPKQNRKSFCLRRSRIFAKCSQKWNEKALVLPYSIVSEKNWWKLQAIRTVCSIFLLF